MIWNIVFWALPFFVAGLVAFLFFPHQPFDFLICLIATLLYFSLHEIVEAIKDIANATKEAAGTIREIHADVERIANKFDYDKLKVEVDTDIPPRTDENSCENEQAAFNRESIKLDIEHLRTRVIDAEMAIYGVIPPEKSNFKMRSWANRRRS